ncbi:PREDICTED: uncharacterized protein LOC109584985 isoform X1 [Amphimedon queenslandica]|uniref:Ig-like domain-containing protein n=1 Tax=Amphimedon queenslandica TaxID=400682 RepID=A0AAN0JI46_AMPQE|nr:PREDICTED: uncharacterized protein LOC109584985 isoform X1 [Amphimedon queenslandica]|eukprot:XP_019856447.1 PREDICTED: uncharacterized protein LOC109584985 isoform X1 [Amphimedon queenslandica]
MFLSHFLFVDLLIGLTIISAPVQGSLVWVYTPASKVLLQPYPGESFTIYCFTDNSSHDSLSFKLNSQTLSTNDNITIETVPLPSHAGKQLQLTINAFGMATAGILTCQAHSDGSVIQEINESITGQNYSLSIAGFLIEGHTESLHCRFYSPGRNASGYTWRGRSNNSQEFVLLAGNSSVLNVNFSLIFDEYSCEVSVTPTNFKLTTNRTVTAYFIPKLTANSTIASTVLIGESITLHCSITGTDLKYTWSRQDGVPLSSLKALTLHNVCYTSTGLYRCTASSLAGNESQIHYLTVQGIPSSPVITDAVTSPGSLVLRVRTMYPGDTNIRFIVNVTNVSDGSIISSTTHHFDNYQSNDIVNIDISIPNGGSVSVSIVTINQYGASDNIIQVFTIDPIFSTTVSIITTSVTASLSASISTTTGSIITNTPTSTPQTVDRSGLSSGAIAGITISIFIILIVFIILFALQHLCLRKKYKKSASDKEVTALGNTLSIPSASNEVYAAIVNVQENVAYSQRHTITAANPPTGSSTTPAVYETIIF